MPRGGKKDAPRSKACVVCGEEFTCRKKWEDAWEEMKTCSRACKKRLDESAGEGGGDESAEAALETTTTELVDSGPGPNAAADAEACVQDEAPAPGEADTAGGDGDPRKAAKRQQKAARRAERQLGGDPNAGRKPCDLCRTLVDVLIRCRTDASGEWRMVCEAACWATVSGGVTDGDAAHPHYRYGGLWRNRRAQQC